MSNNSPAIIVAAWLVILALYAHQVSIGRKLDRIADEMERSRLYTVVPPAYGKIEYTHPIYRIPAEEVKP